MTTPPNNALLDSDQVLLLNQALHQVSDAVFLIDDALRFLFVNETACRNLGYSREELLAMSPSDIIPDVAGDMMTGIVATRSPSFESRYCSKDGRILPIEINASPFEWRGKTCSLCIARDLTERKRLQETLIAREREYRLLTDDFPENLLRYDMRCRCIYANPRIETTLGIPAKSIIGKTPMELFPAGQYREYQDRIEKVLQTDSDDEMEVVLSDPTGKNRYH
ncbi:MAG: PAS domain S-box protein, partial [Desulfuromonadaceae bacterium]